MIGLFIAAALAAPAFVEQPCPASELSGKARCGAVTVLEDRAKPDGRTIKLNVIVIPATGKRRLPPLFEIDGGPGLADTKSSVFYLADGAAYHRDRDVVLIDQRGTGGSSPLNCPELDTADRSYQLEYPIEAVRRCRVTLEQAADLRHYGTTDAIADLDDVRAALGYDRIDLSALSYGTTAALRYIATYPTRVRAAILMSVAPPFATVPRYHATAADEAFGRLNAECRKDAKCHAAFDPERDLTAALEALPTIAGPPPRDVFMEKLRSQMYAPATARSLPYIIHAAAQRDLKPFFDATRPRGPYPYSLGMYLTVTCSEGFAQFDFAEAAAAARRTRFGDYRLQRQRAACAEWPTARVPDEFQKLPSTNTAVLIVSGSLDPVTPAEWGARVARALPNARQVMVPQMGHNFDGLSGVDTCLDPLMLRFYETGDAKALDADCLLKMAPPPFKTGK